MSLPFSATRHRPTSGDIKLPQGSARPGLSTTLWTAYRPNSGYLAKRAYSEATGRFGAIQIYQRVGIRPLPRSATLGISRTTQASSSTVALRHRPSSPENPPGNRQSCVNIQISTQSAPRRHRYHTRGPVRLWLPSLNSQTPALKAHQVSSISQFRLQSAGSDLAGGTAK